MTRRFFLLGASFLAIGLSASGADARLVRIEVAKVAPADPRPGAAPYEIVSGRFFGEVDPRDAHNTIITDLAGAPRNIRGKVEYSATFAIARPVDPARRSGVLFYDVPNRGNFVLGADASGHVRVVSGWQGDLPEDPGLLTARVPTAQGPDGQPLTGPVLARFVDMPAGTTTLPITGSIGRPTPRPAPLTLDTRQARFFRHPLTTRRRRKSRRATGRSRTAPPRCFRASRTPGGSACARGSTPASPTP